jgi:CheY-like chemotaxis protein
MARNTFGSNPGLPTDPCLGHFAAMATPSSPDPGRTMPASVQNAREVTEHASPPGRAPLGRDYLEQRSRVMKRVKSLANPPELLLVDDEPADAAALSTALKMIFGARLPLQVVSTVEQMRKSIASRKPDVVLLDDRLKPKVTADISLPLLRKDGFNGPVIVIAGLLSPQRHAELVRLGACEVIHKDDLDSTRVAEAVLRAIGQPA